MNRAFALALLAVALLPAQAALACGMYIPPEREAGATLAQLLEEVDQAAPVEAAPVVADANSQDTVKVQASVLSDVLNAVADTSDSDAVPAQAAIVPQS